MFKHATWSRRASTAEHKHTQTHTHTHTHTHTQTQTHTHTHTHLELVDDGSARVRQRAVAVLRGCYHRQPILSRECDTRVCSDIALSVSLDASQRVSSHCEQGLKLCDTLTQSGSGAAGRAWLLAVSLLDHSRAAGKSVQLAVWIAIWSPGWPVQQVRNETTRGLGWVCGGELERRFAACQVASQGWKVPPHACSPTEPHNHVCMWTWRHSRAWACRDRAVACSTCGDSEPEE
jgi:hypothetical protein